MLSASSRHAVTRRSTHLASHTPHPTSPTQPHLACTHSATPRFRPAPVLPLYLLCPPPQRLNSIMAALREDPTGPVDSIQRKWFGDPGRAAAHGGASDSQDINMLLVYIAGGFFALYLLLSFVRVSCSAATPCVCGWGWGWGWEWGLCVAEAELSRLHDVERGHLGAPLSIPTSSPQCTLPSLAVPPLAAVLVCQVLHTSQGAGSVGEVVRWWSPWGHGPAGPPPTWATG